MDASAPKNYRSPLPWLITAALFAILGLHLALAWSGAGRVRDQHLGTALLYARGELDLARPVIVGFTATSTPTPQEIPLWQAATGLTMRALGDWWGWGNVVAWVFFASCVLPFYRLATRHLGDEGGGWATLALLLQPLIWLEAGQAGTDGTSFAVCVWLVYLMDRMVRTGSWALAVAAAGVAALAATQKLPFFMAAGIAGIGLVWLHARFDPRTWLRLGFVGIAGSVVFLLWNHHAECELGRAELPLMELRVGENPTMREWYFGTWAYRLNPANWLRAGYRIAQGVVGSFTLLPLVAWALLDRKQGLARWWLAGAFLTTLVFSHLVLHHWHYYLMVSAGLALLLGGALAKISEWARAATPGCWHWIVPTAGASVLLLAAIQGSHSSNFFLRDDFPSQVAQTIGSHTFPQERLLIAGGGWGGLELMMSDRPGLTINDASLLESPATRARLRELGYTKLVLLSQSPRNSAMAMIGGSQTRRGAWTDLQSPIMKKWPVVYEDEAISIRRIPVDE